MVDYSGTPPLFGNHDGADAFLASPADTPAQFIDTFCNAIIPKTRPNGDVFVDKIQVRFCLYDGGKNEARTYRGRRYLNATFGKVFMRNVDSLWIDKMREYNARRRAILNGGQGNG